MIESSLTLARERYQRGRYAEALRLVTDAAVRTPAGIEERDCILCECLQQQGRYDEALRRAHTALGATLTAERAARYWGVIGRIQQDQANGEQATEALRKGIRAAAKAGDLQTLASLQQLWLVTASSQLGAGLNSAVREAYSVAVRSGDAATLASFHIRLSQLEGQRGAFSESLHHLSLARALLSRSDNVALAATFHVNQACVLGLVGAFDEARRSAEEGAILAEEAGCLRLSMAAAANVAHIAVAAGDLKAAETWLGRAQKAMETLGLVENNLLESLASFALVRGDIEGARQHLLTARAQYNLRGAQWIEEGEAYTLLTELYIARQVDDRARRKEILARLKDVANGQHSPHLQLLSALAEAEANFDETQLPEAHASVATCVRDFPLYTVHRAELNRMAARGLWLAGHRSSAKRKLLRACSIGLTHGSRLTWAQAVTEVRSIDINDTSEAAYSLQHQLEHGEAKFAPLLKSAESSWFRRVPPGGDFKRDDHDGFDEAVAILELADEPELRGREALASAMSLRICHGAALLLHTNSGSRIIASSGWSKPEVHKASKDSKSTRIEVSRSKKRTLELLLSPKPDLRSAFAISGIRRLLEAAAAVEGQKNQRHRLSSLWQHENIVNEPDAVFSSPRMIELMLTARKVAPTRLPVLLLGQTGTGKEVLAKAIHRASARADKVFLAFNCSAVPRDMVESQLFGYRRGAFTSASEDFPGIIRSAEGGTLFLDEIGELSIDLQPKLLRFLETSEVHPLGQGRPVKVDVRVMAATNAELDDLVERKAFREDLYYRLNIVSFQMPPLRERREEIPQLVAHLVMKFEIEENKHSIQVSDELMEYLVLYSWPGNIRQLSNELRRLVAITQSNETLMSEHLSAAIRTTRRSVTTSEDPDAAASPPTGTASPKSLALELEQPLPEAVEALERAMIEHAIARAQGKVEEAARLLGISRKGLFLKRRRWLDEETPSTDV